MNITKGATMKQNTVTVNEMISKITITNDAKPEIAQAILSWTKDTVTTIVSKDKF